MISIAHSDVPTVLSVEDDPVIRFVMQDMLKDGGFRVEIACDADEALKILYSDSAIDALFTDIDVPGSMNGIELAHLVRIEGPLMAIVVASGHIRTAPFLMVPPSSPSLTTLRALLLICTQIPKQGSEFWCPKR